MNTQAHSEYLPIKVQFSGGLEALFANKRDHDLQLPILVAHDASQNGQWNVSKLIDHLHASFLLDSPKAELFVMNGTVRPGILVLINDADWELEGEGEYKLKAGDEIVFVSTLHGG